MVISGGVSYTYLLILNTRKCSKTIGKTFCCRCKADDSQIQTLRICQSHFEVRFRFSITNVDTSEILTNEFLRHVLATFSENFETDWVEIHEI